jgi:hypothetical protein
MTCECVGKMKSCMGQGKPELQEQDDDGFAITYSKARMVPTMKPPLKPDGQSTSRTDSLLRDHVNFNQPRRTVYFADGQSTS